MAKRFTDTEKWKDDWFLNLSDLDKTIWQYVMDNCSHAGILKKSVNHLNFCCKTNLTVDNFFKKFEEKLVDRGDYFFIPCFLKDQYPKGLNSEKPTIVSARNEAILLDLVLIIRERFGNDYLIIKDKDMDKDKETDMDRVKKGHGGISGYLKVCRECDKSFLYENQYEAHLKFCRKVTSSY